MHRFEPHPQSAPGDFYIVNEDCVCCGAPHLVAPDLIGWAPDGSNHCVWKKQPGSAEELEQAFAAFDVCCIECYRYSGSDKAIQKRLGKKYCDQPD